MDKGYRYQLESRDKLYHPVIQSTYIYCGLDDWMKSRHKRPYPLSVACLPFSRSDSIPWQEGLLFLLRKE